MVFEHSFYPHRMAARHHPTSSTDRIVVARLHGASTRLAGWDPPVGQERQVAILELQGTGGDQPEPYAHTAGIMTGMHPENDPSHVLYRNAAALLLEAAGLTLEDERVQHWIRVGEERRDRAKKAFQVGDPRATGFKPPAPPHRDSDPGS